MNTTKPKTQFLRLAIISVCLFVSIFLISCGRFTDNQKTEKTAFPTPSTTATPTIELLPFGNPSNAATGGDLDNYLIIHDGHVMSYNNSRGTANWVAWKTNKDDLGSSIPRPLFEPDPKLGAEFTKIAYYDYSGSGYDRGHLVPSADRFGNKKQNLDTFFMTNIVPQTDDLNRFAWEKLESYARRLVGRGYEIYSIAGVYGDKGRLRGKITVPTNCWKVIVVFPRGHRGNQINEKTRIIAVDMPNIQGVEEIPWEKYLVAISEIELKTGLDLFSDLPKETQQLIESRVTINGSQP